MKGWSASGLSLSHRHIARERAVQAAVLGLHHAAELHYTQDPQRWEGIDHHLVAAKGQYPRHADCSSFATWCLWNGLYVQFGLSDFVNGDNWRAGYTGTMAQNGKRVQHVQNVVRADCVLYGPAPTYEHTAIIVGSRNGKPIVVSNGSEDGPFLLPFDYRSDVGEIRRYI